MTRLTLLLANLVGALVIATLVVTKGFGWPYTDSDAQARLAETVERLRAEALAICQSGASAVPAGPEIAATAPPEPAPPPLPPVTPPDPRDALVGSGDAATPLVEVIERGVVMVIAEQGESQLGLGSGFLIDPRHVVTNQHVMGDADTAMIVNRYLGRAVEGRVIARTDVASPKQAPDFAVLELPEPLEGLTPLAIAAGARKLQSVVSAGFPGFLLGTDSDFQRLRAGDLSAAPEVILSEGVVRRPGNVKDATPIILHSADIAQGNSGGPLVDACGQVLGVNTLTVADGEDSYRAGFALASEALLAFLEPLGLSARLGEPCQPRPTGGESAGK